MERIRKLKNEIRYRVTTNLEILGFEEIYLDMVAPDGIEKSIKPELKKHERCVSCDVTKTVLTKRGRWFFRFRGENTIRNKDCVLGMSCELKNPHW